MQPTLLITGPGSLSLPLSPELTTADRQQITTVDLTYTLGPLKHVGEQIQTSLLAEIKYCYASGTVHAREWVRVPILLQRRGEAWICKAGQSWSWSTDWQD